ncbi:MAG: fasciclin domain-containing protein, partial [Myxococcota bacterium]
MTWSTGCLTARPDDSRPSVLEALRADSRFSTLTRLLNESGVTEELDDSEDWTIFAPTDAAFAQVGELFAPDRINKDGLRAALQFHIVEGVVPATELAKEPSIDTLIGLPLVVRTEADRLLVGAAVVSESNISARNGI